MQYKKFIAVWFLAFLGFEVSKAQVVTSPNLPCSNGCGRCLASLNTCQECGPLYYFDHNFRICIQGVQPGCLIYRARNICV